MWVSCRVPTHVWLLRLRIFYYEANTLAKPGSPSGRTGTKWTAVSQRPNLTLETPHKQYLHNVSSNVFEQRQTAKYHDRTKASNLAVIPLFKAADIKQMCGDIRTCEQYCT